MRFCGNDQRIGGPPQKVMIYKDLQSFYELFILFFRYGLIFEIPLFQEFL